jgi:hypothetical protein
MFRDKSLDGVQLVLSEVSCLGFLDRLKPELRNLAVVFDVHVSRLTPIATGEEESMLPDELDRRHRTIFSRTPFRECKILTL